MYRCNKGNIVHFWFTRPTSQFRVFKKCYFRRDGKYCGNWSPFCTPLFLPIAWKVHNDSIVRYIRTIFLAFRIYIMLTNHTYSQHLGFWFCRNFEFFACVVRFIMSFADVVSLLRKFHQEVKKVELHFKTFNFIVMCSKNSITDDIIVEKIWLSSF